MEKDTYITSEKRITGHDYKTVYHQARDIYKKLALKSKRRVYIRSQYFKKEKIFLDLFWQHIHDKSRNDQTRRLRFYPCAIDLLEHTRILPVIKNDPNKPSDKLYKFKGVTKQHEVFYVQIKIEKDGSKYFISVFPE